MHLGLLQGLDNKAKIYIGFFESGCIHHLYVICCQTRATSSCPAYASLEGFHMLQQLRVRLCHQQQNLNRPVMEDCVSVH